MLKSRLNFVATYFAVGPVNCRFRSEGSRCILLYNFILTKELTPSDWRVAPTRLWEECVWKNLTIFL